MIRRLCASLLVVALLGQTGVSLYACTQAAGSHDHHGAAGETGRPGQVAGSPHDEHRAVAARADGRDDHTLPPAGPAALDVASAAHEPGAAAPRHCNRHDRKACPHSGPALHPCDSDPAAGLQGTEAGIPPTPPGALLVANLSAPSALHPVRIPPQRSRSPELPPPRAL